MRNDLVFPSYFSIQTTSLCNASCIFCPYKDIKDLFPHKIMDMNLCKKIIDECSNYKNIEKIILYMNNEPLTDPNLIERINYAKEKIPWASVHILTNGLLLTEKMSEKLINSKLDWIGISFHGIRKETIEKSMGMPFEVSFKGILNLIEKAKKKRDIKEFIMITFLKHKYLTDNEKEETMNFWKDKGIERISYFDGPISRTGNVEDLPKVYHKEKIIGCKSIWADEMLHIVENGKVVLCCMDWRREVILGDLNKQSIYDVWNGERKEIWEMVRGKEEMPDNFLCRRCEEAKLYEKISYRTRAIANNDKSCDFLLINLPPWAQENPHIGVGYLCSYLHCKGLRLKVIDLNKSFYLNHPDFRMLWHVENKNFWSNANTFPLILKIFEKDIEKAIEETLTYDCKVLGFSVVDPKERLTIEFIKRIKKRDSSKSIILGGPATSTYEQRRIFLDNIADSIDAFVIGEGEETLFYLLDRFLNEKKIIDAEGCYVRNNGKWVYKERLPINPLDKISFPTYEEFDMRLYGKSLLVEWSRGCRGKCAFCKNYRLFPAYRSKSVDWITNELRFHKERYNIEEFTVVDNILNGDLENLDRICKRIIDDNLKIRWTGQIAPHKNMDYDFFKTMKKAGCFKLQIGLESGSDKVLKLMRKTFTSGISERNIRFAKKAGIETEIFTMIGFPGETEKDFKKTYDFVKRNARFIDILKSINTLHLIAGTEVYEKACEKFNMKPLPKENWHYLWETYSGNNYEVRKRRAQRLLDLAYNSGIRVMETNIREGKEAIFEDIKNKEDLTRKVALLKDSINDLQGLPQRKEIIRTKHSIFKWMILICVSFYTFIYIIYFGIYAKIRNKVLLGGRRSR